MASGKNKSTQSGLSKTDVQILVIVVAFLVTILASVATFVWVYQPMNEELDQLNQTYDGLQFRVEEAKRVPAQISSYRAKIDELEGQTTEDEGAETDELRKEIDVPTILAIVEQSATDADMKLSRIAMDGNAAYIKGGVVGGVQPDKKDEGDEIETPEVNASSFYRLGISMDVTAVNYSGLMQFLANMEDAGYYLTTSSAALNTQDGTTYTGSINFYIYSFVASNK